jgi:hypothetical protein
LGYRGHFGRIGFDEALTELEDRHDPRLRGQFVDDSGEPVRLVNSSTGLGATSAFRRLAEELDTAIVRVVSARPGLESITAVMGRQPSERVLIAGILSAGNTGSHCRIHRAGPDDGIASARAGAVAAVTLTALMVAAWCRHRPDRLRPLAAPAISPCESPSRRTFRHHA